MYRFQNVLHDVFSYGCTRRSANTHVFVNDVFAIIFTAITALQSSSSDDRDDRGGFGERRGGMGGGMMGFGSPFGFGYGFSPLDLFFPRPFGFYSYGWFAPPPRMSLPEAIFSFVFGDGDPNTV